MKAQAQGSAQQLQPAIRFTLPPPPGQLARSGCLFGIPKRVLKAAPAC